MKIINNKFGFTLAEVLITLVIIGVIAAITVPTIMANARKTEVETRLKQTYSMLNNAITRAVTDFGPINTWEEMAVTTSLKTTSFFSKYLQPYLILNKPAANYTLEELGYKTDIHTSNGKSVSLSKTKRSGKTVLNNGVVLIGFAGRGITQEDNDSYAYGLTFEIDVNGPKGKNTQGKDVFTYVLYTVGTTHVFELLGVHEITKESSKSLYETGTGNVELEVQDRKTIIKACKNYGLECGALIQLNGWKIPKDYPLNI